MNKPKSFLEKKIEGFFIWAIENRYKLFLFVVFSGFFTILSFSPYFNLIIGKVLLSFLILMSYLIFFRVNYKICFILGLLFLILALPFVIFGEYETAEELANFTYGIFFLGLIKFILSKDA